MSDTILFILCCMAGGCLFGVVWLAVKLEIIRDKIEEILKWM